MWFLTMEGPYLLLVFLLCAGFVSGQRSRSRILRERLYLETLANQTGVINTTALNAMVTKPLESTTATPTPVTEGMDYEGSGFFDVFWKLTARAVTPSTTALPTTPGSSTSTTTTTPSPRLFTYAFGLCLISWKRTRCRRKSSTDISISTRVCMARKSGKYVGRQKSAKVLRISRS